MGRSASAGRDEIDRFAIQGPRKEYKRVSDQFCSVFRGRLAGLECVWFSKYMLALPSALLSFFSSSKFDCLKGCLKIKSMI